MKTKLFILLLLLTSFQIGKSQFNVSILSQDVCFGTPINFSSISSPTSATSWYWDFGDGDTSTMQSPMHLYNSAGNFLVTLIASDGVDIDTAYATAYVRPIPLVNFGYSMSGGLTVNFNDSSTITNDSIAAWSWDFGDGNTSSLQNPSHTYSFPPDSCYDVTLTAISQYGCVSSLTLNSAICITNINKQTTKNINIYPNPIISNQFSINGELQSFETALAYDVLGNEIDVPIITKSTNEIVLNTQQLKKGTYFIKVLFENDSPITKTIIVQ